MTLSRFFRLLAAYLVVLHAMGMAAMAAPSPADPFGVICTIDGHSSGQDDPVHPSHHVPCALCGLGACAVAAPPEVVVPAEFPREHINVPRVEARVVVTARPCVVPQPRGPPAAV
jgi:hypothetical protein